MVISVVVGVIDNGMVIGGVDGDIIVIVDVSRERLVAVVGPAVVSVLVVVVEGSVACDVSMVAIASVVAAASSVAVTSVLPMPEPVMLPVVLTMPEPVVLTMPEPVVLTMPEPVVNGSGRLVDGKGDTAPVVEAGASEVVPGGVTGGNVEDGGDVMVVVWVANVVLVGVANMALTASSTCLLKVELVE